MIPSRVSPVSVLLAACAALIVLLFWQWSDGSHRWQPGPAHPVDPALFEVDRQDPRLSETASPDPTRIAERPLFVPGRRPISAPEGDRPQHATTSGVSLIGVFQTERSAGALLLIDGEARRMLLGESDKGLTLQEILDDAVLLRDRDGHAIEYRMRRQLPEPAATEGSPDATPQSDPPEDLFED